MDARDAENLGGKWYKSFDSKQMVFTIITYDEEDYEVDMLLPAMWEVCDLCSGRGSHVNPSIDSHGLTAEDFDEDPDFRDDYMAGIYDVACYRCDGRTTEPVVDESRCTPEQLKVYNDWMQNFCEAREQEAYCMRMGF